jgi:hypothetical protein
MASESDEPDNAAARLEAALERIAAAATRRASAPSAPPAVVAPPAVTPDVNAGTAVAPEIAARLDGLIERLRGALAVRPG